MLMRKRATDAFHFIIFILLLSTLAAACAPLPATPAAVQTEPAANPGPTSTATPIPTRPVYDPGTLVDYRAQAGDTLAAVAAHFNTSVREILEANPEIDKKVTTLNPGESLKIPIYYEALWGSAFQILPDWLFVNGPAQVGFDVRAYVDSQPGYLKNYSFFAGNKTRRGGELVEYIAQNFSVSPRLLLALVEYQAGVLSQALLPPNLETYPLGYEDQYHKGLYLQMLWAANTLNNGYYNWRTGKLDAIDHLDGTLEHPDPWQNAATVALQYYFSLETPVDDYYLAISSEGFYKTYTRLFGDPWAENNPHIPGNLQQPSLILPFELGKTWAYTGGPHTAWGEGEPLAAIDFAPPATIGGCSPSSQYVTAIADGQIVRSEPAIAVLDLNEDGDERTGWVIFYLHLGLTDKVRSGVLVKQGDPIGHPSCEGGSATGTHVHIARKYNGEWILADGPLAFNLEGWVSANGSEPYLGTLTKVGRIVEACTCSDAASQIEAGLYNPPQ